MLCFDFNVDNNLTSLYFIYSFHNISFSLSRLFKPGFGLLSKMKKTNLISNKYKGNLKNKIIQCKKTADV